MTKVLVRQRILVELLQNFPNKTATRLQLTKLAFLLSQEMPSGGGDSFYQFVPYKYGPYSFSLYHEVGNLIRDGLIVEEDSRRWRLTDEGARKSIELPSTVSKDVNSIISRYGKWSASKLITLVYERFSWYSVNSEKASKRALPRPHAPIAVYTIGYEGVTVDGFLDTLVRSGISVLIDVRNNPISRRYGFHKSTLSRLCSYLDIDYFHFPEVGIKSVFRSSLDTPGDYDNLFSLYNETTIKQEREAIITISHLIQQEPSALVCVEADPGFCHRSHLAHAVSEQTQLPVVHLGCTVGKSKL